MHMYVIYESYVCVSVCVCMYNLFHNTTLVVCILLVEYEVRFDLTVTLFLSNKIRAHTYYQVY